MRYLLGEAMHLTITLALEDDDPHPKTLPLCQLQTPATAEALQQQDGKKMGQQAVLQGESWADNLGELPLKELLTCKGGLEEFCSVCRELSSADCHPDQPHLTQAAVPSSACFSSSLLSLGNVACSRAGREPMEENNAMQTAGSSALEAKEAGMCLQGLKSTCS